MYMIVIGLEIWLSKILQSKSFLLKGIFQFGWQYMHIWVTWVVCLIPYLPLPFPLPLSFLFFHLQDTYSLFSVHPMQLPEIWSNSILSPVLQVERGLVHFLNHHALSLKGELLIKSEAK